MLKERHGVLWYSTTSPVLCVSLWKPWQRPIPLPKKLIVCPAELQFPTKFSWPQRPKEKADYPLLTSEHLKLKIRLSQRLIQVEENLIRKLTLSSTPHFADAKISETQRVQFAKEVFVNSTMQWKSVFGRLRRDPRKSIDSEHMIDWDDPDDPGLALHACADDMKQLWHDPVIQRLLELQNLRIEEVAGL